MLPLWAESIWLAAYLPAFGRCVERIYIIGTAAGRGPAFAETLLDVAPFMRRRNPVTTS